MVRYQSLAVLQVSQFHEFLHLRSSTWFEAFVLNPLTVQIASSRSTPLEGTLVGFGIVVGGKRENASMKEGCYHADTLHFNYSFTGHKPAGNWPSKSNKNSTAVTARAVHVAMHVRYFRLAAEHINPGEKRAPVPQNRGRKGCDTPIGKRPLLSESHKCQPTPIYIYEITPPQTVLDCQLGNIRSSK